MPRNKEKQKIKQHESYLRNKEKYLERQKEKRNKNRDFVLEIKKKSKCVICGEDRFQCLDFHHRDGTKKDNGIGEMSSSNVSIKKIAEEIEKCDIFCSNCHRIKHWEELYG
jgi:hypothetical protein